MAIVNPAAGILQSMGQFANTRQQIAAQERFMAEQARIRAEQARIRAEQRRRQDEENRRSKRGVRHRLVGATLGGVAGFFMGGPAGAAIGVGVGSQLGNPQDQGGPDPIALTQLGLQGASLRQQQQQQQAQQQYMQNLFNPRPMPSNMMMGPEGAVVGPPPSLPQRALSGAPNLQTAGLGLQFLQAAKPQQPERFTLGPGQTRFEGTTQIASVPISPSKPSVRSQKISDLMTQFSLKRPQAVAVVDGRSRIELTDFGWARLINDITNTVTEIRIKGASSTTAAAESAISSTALAAMHDGARQASHTIGPEGPVHTGIPGTLWEASGDATGFVSWGKDLWARTAGQIPGVPISEEVVDSRSFYRQAGRQLVKALSVNPRFPVAEQEMISKAVSLEPKVFDSPPALRARLQRLDTVLAGKIRSEQQIANDPNMPDAMREVAKRSINDMQNFRNLMGVPQPGTRPQQPQPQLPQQTQQPPPAPPRESRRIGEVYTTGRGPAIWRGTGWEPVQ